jgi:CBS domain-containing protein
MIRIKDWMSSPVITIKPSASILEAATLMDKHNIGCLVVQGRTKIHGIITERDILRKIVAKKKSPGRIKVEDAMTEEVHTVNINAKLLEVTKIMDRHNFRRIVVLEKGKLAGILTSRDLIGLVSV